MSPLNCTYACIKLWRLCGLVCTPICPPLLNWSLCLPLLLPLSTTFLSKMCLSFPHYMNMYIYMQAILTSEPSHTGQPCLKTAMRTLLTVAQNCREPTSVAMTPPSSDSTPSNTEDITTSGTQLSSATVSEQQPQSASVHALNILRALYRDSRLGEQVLPFIPEGVMIAIQGFSATFWPVSQ